MGLSLRKIISIMHAEEKVQLSHCSWANMAHIQYRPLLILKLTLSQISKQSLKNCGLEPADNLISITEDNFQSPAESLSLDKHSS